MHLPARPPELKQVACIPRSRRSLFSYSLFGDWQNVVEWHLVVTHAMLLRLCTLRPLYALRTTVRFIFVSFGGGDGAPEERVGGREKRINVCELQLEPKWQRLNTAKHYVVRRRTSYLFCVPRQKYHDHVVLFALTF